MPPKRKSSGESESAEKKRKICFTQAARLAEKIETNGDSWNKIQLSIQLNFLEKCYNNFDEVEDEDSAEREQFENIYFNLKEKLLALESNLNNVRNSNNSSSISSSSNSARSKSIFPAMELPKFDGSYDRWTDFINMFNVLVHNDKDLSDIEKFQFLRNCLSGSAIKVVDSLECNHENYVNALELLKNRFENKRLIFNAHMCKLINLPSISKPSASQLSLLIDKVNVEMKALHSLGSNEQISDALLIHFIASKLDNTTRIKWEESISINEIPKFSEFIGFLQLRQKRLDCLQHSLPFSSNFSAFNNRKETNSNRYIHVSASQKFCLLCNQNIDHFIYNCPKFHKLSIRERYDVARKLKLCSNCLKAGHFAKNCSSSSCPKCSKHHHISLHQRYNNPFLNKPSTSKSVETQKRFDCLSSLTSNNIQVIIATAVVEVISTSGLRTLCRILLDSASQTNLITERFTQQMYLKKTISNTTFVGVGSKQTSVRYQTNFLIKSLQGSYCFPIDALVISKITADQPPEFIDTTGWKIPKNVRLADPEFNIPARVDILLEAELFMKLLCIGQIDLGKSLPTLQKTVFGWVVSGKSSTLSEETLRSTCASIVKRDNDTKLEPLIRKFWEIENISCTSPPLSYEEKLCEQYFIRTTQRTSEGRFIVRLPFKESKLKLGLSAEIAKRRFYNIEKKIYRDSNIHHRYLNLMTEYEKLGHMEFIDCSTSNHYYLPHHGIKQKSNLDKKLRVVFDASCKTSTGVSPNDILMVGPKLQDEIFVVLCRFRCYRYVLSADIIKMYRQILIHSDDTNFQLIWWRQKNSDELKTCRLKTVTYGTACAPYLAMRCLKQLSLEHKKEFPLGASTLEKNLYVDDILTGADSADNLKEIRSQLANVLEKGGFELHKWSSNSVDVLRHINAQEIQTSVSIGDHETIKTLGLHWQPREDKFLYQFKTNSPKITKRSVLSVIASFFDPLGLINPFIVLTKIFMQTLWKSKLEWDESLPAVLHTQWLQILNQIDMLHQIHIDRYVFCVEYTNIQLHGFADASQSAYGACIYVRSVANSNQLNVSLLCAKSRVAPLKTLSIARLELCAALLLTELVEKVLSSFDRNVDQIYCWSDSLITLSWINASPSLYSVFVSHRISKIQTISEPHSISWRHVSSENNPADIISRGTLPENLVNNTVWFNGPAFLKQDESKWPISCDIQTSQEEMKKENFILISVITTDVVSSSKYINSFSKIRRIFSYAFRFIKNCKVKMSKSISACNKVSKIVLNPEDLLNGEKMMIKIIQNSIYKKEIKYLKEGKPIGKDNHLLSLHLFLDKENIIRVGGRLQNSCLDFDNKHQILLPKDHAYTRSLINYMHVKNMHVGMLTLNAMIRERFWIPGSRNLIRFLIHKCISCFRQRPRKSYQIMGQLPSSRVTPSPPFSNSGVDYCGPFLVKQLGRGNRPIKVYICIFICFSTKAVHMEVVNSLSTEGFIAALKRFTGRRGKCKSIMSDNATNFLGAKRELKELRKLLLSQTHNDLVKAFCLEEGVEWKFIPPRSPHFGGLWEAAVKKAKYHLSRVLKNNSLRAEEFNTVVVQIEAILNSRPLTPMSSDPTDLEVLTPAHFLIGRQMQTIPEPDILSVKYNRLTQWQMISRIQQLFWKRWTKEYLYTLQQRNKWQSPTRNLKEGDMVLIQDEHLPPMSWALGRILSVIQGNDKNIRVADVKTSSGIFRRSTNKLCLLPTEDGESNC